MLDQHYLEGFWVDGPTKVLGKVSTPGTIQGDCDIFIVRGVDCFSEEFALTETHFGKSRLEMFSL